MNSNKLHFILFILSFCLIQSCSKEEQKIQGCTDIDSIAYNPMAEENDGSCVYTGGAVFYHDMTTSTNLGDAEISMLKYSVDNELEHELLAAINWFGIPDCTNPTAYALNEVDLGNNKSKEFAYSIRDQNENILETGVFTIEANECCKQILFDY